MRFATIPSKERRQSVTGAFLGYNHNLRIGEGNDNALEFYDMRNLSSDYYPLFAPRPGRGLVTTLTAPKAIHGKAQLAYIDGTSLYYAGQDITGYLTAKGASISSQGDKQLVSMGAYLLIFPDKLYINTADYDDCGKMEATWEASAEVTYSPCTADGAPISIYSGDTEPETKTNGSFWLDTSSSPASLKVWSETSSMWIGVATSYTQISATGIGAGFKQGDAVKISGAQIDDNEYVAALNGTKVIQSISDDSIVVIGLMDAQYTQQYDSTAPVTAERKLPAMDYVTEAGNRLWGCRYGAKINEIYACALGDFKNWNVFQGLSTDSYSATVGTDGEFTGAITHLGCPLFFKEGYLHKVYVSSTGAHQITTISCRGVQRGCHKSLAIVNETLFYRSRSGICAYDGSLPVNVDTALGGVKYYDAVGGALGNKYYCSMRAGEAWSLFVYDVARGLWHREDDTCAIGFAEHGNELYCLCDDGRLLALTGQDGSGEEGFTWMGESGIIGYSSVNQKYVGKIVLRMKIPEGSCTAISIEYDSCGEWEHCGSVEGHGTQSFELPIRPHRCDHFRLKLEGTGQVRIYSISKILESGSDKPW